MKYEKVFDFKGNYIEGPLIITPQVYSDKRGSFYESWNKYKFNNFLKEEIEFVQDNHSQSKKGTLRGLHFQINPEPQSKLVRCISGNIFDVIVDLRESSKTFGKWIGLELSDKNKKLFWVPRGFAHGFLTLSEYAEVLYKTDNYWFKDLERSLCWNDNLIDIKWPLEKNNIRNPILSEKDFSAESFLELKSKGETF